MDDNNDNNQDNNKNKKNQCLKLIAASKDHKKVTDAAAAAYPSNPSLDSTSMNGGNLCIKLKISQNIAHEEDKNTAQAQQQLHEPAGKDGHRVCEECGKVFSSGKAWGGHKRHHIKALKESLKKAKILKPKKTNLSKKKKCNTIKAGDVKIMRGGKPICCLCGKLFPSMNSLFGHMRFHPGRGWKGTHPPSSKSSNRSSGSSASSSSESDQEVEYDDYQLSLSAKAIGLKRNISLSSLSCWMKKDRRGKASTFDPARQAAFDLMMLSRDGSSGLKIEGSLAEYYQSKKKLRINEKGSGKNMSNELNCAKDIKGKGKGLMMDDSEQDRDGFEYYQSKKQLKINEKRSGKNLLDELNYVKDGKRKRADLEQDREDFDEKKVIKKKIKKMKVQNLVGNLADCETTGRNIKCTEKLEESTALVHDNSFAADGKYRSHNLAARESKETEAESNEGEQNQSILPAENKNPFQCDICNRTFLTGQALGGHKRCHFKSTPVKAPVNNEAAAAALPVEAANHTPNNSTPSSGKASHHSILGIDLNKPYVEE